MDAYLTLGLSLAPVAAGVLIGMMARWARERNTGGLPALTKAVLLDVPSLLAVTVLTGYLARKAGADVELAVVFGTVAGYTDALKAIVGKLPVPWSGVERRTRDSGKQAG